MQQRPLAPSARRAPPKHDRNFEHSALNNSHTYCRIRQGEAFVNDELLYQHMGDESFLMGLYRHLGISYPKFFKMDELSRLAFLGSEMVLLRCDRQRYADDEVAMVFANRSSSLTTDAQFQLTLDGGIPSPALFVYTLPNIGMGEVCIRHGLYGENTFLVMESFDSERLLQFANPQLEQGAAKAVLIAWLETDGKGHDGFFFFIENPEDTDAAELQRSYDAP